MDVFANAKILNWRQFTMVISEKYIIYTNIGAYIY